MWIGQYVSLLDCECFIFLATVDWFCDTFNEPYLAWLTMEILHMIQNKSTLIPIQKWIILCHFTRPWKHMIRFLLLAKFIFVTKLICFHLNYFCSVIKTKFIMCMSQRISQLLKQKPSIHSPVSSYGSLQSCHLVALSSVSQIINSLPVCLDRQRLVKQVIQLSLKTPQVAR